MTNSVFVSFSDQLQDKTLAIYHPSWMQTVFDTALSVMNDKLQQGINFTYFANAQKFWHKPKSLGVYITDIDEGQVLNLEARGKNYATNVLSYPSDLPSALLSEMEDIHLGELVLCHNVIENEALAQQKSFDDHLTHLIVHGILHLLGFDHEISDMAADEMESFEIEILSKLQIPNPYL